MPRIETLHMKVSTTVVKLHIYLTRDCGAAMAKGSSPHRGESKMWRRTAKASRKLEAASSLEKEIEARKEVEKERERDRGVLGIGLRRGKATGARSWLRIDAEGNCEVGTSIRKHHISMYISGSPYF